MTESRETGSPRDPLPSWSWKAPDRNGDEPLLLYEPGNWGDVLKGSWALLAVRFLLREGGAKSLRCLDPCAGQPTYPLAESAARRLHLLRGRVFHEAQKAFTDGGGLASTGLLVREACAGAGIEYELYVFDAEASRLKMWETLDGVRTLSVGTGEAALDAGRGADFILVDPYDFFDRWGQWLPRALDAARDSLVLVYLHNKSPRGRGHLDQYRRLRTRLGSAVEGGIHAVLGRIAADAVLPRAYHEVVLVGPPGKIEPLKPALAEETRALARLVAEEGAFEEIGGA